MTVCDGEGAEEVRIRFVPRPNASQLRMSGYPQLRGHETTLGWRDVTKFIVVGNGDELLNCSCRG